MNIFLSHEFGAKKLKALRVFPFVLFSYRISMEVLPLKNATICVRHELDIAELVEINIQPDIINLYYLGNFTVKI